MGLSTKRGPNVKMFLGQNAPVESSEEKFWASLTSRISSGQAIPIISGSMVYDLVFQQAMGDAASDTPEAGEEEQESCGPEVRFTALNLLTMAWSSSIGYPFPDNHELARVAQYLRSKYKVAVPAREEFLRFLKDALLNYASGLGGDPDQIEELRGSLDEFSFADLAVRELGLVKFGPGAQDPLSTLARLPLPIYLTTSHHEFLELALEAVGKKPITQICFWSGTPSPLPEKYRPIEEFEPSPERPLVYHLYGLDRFPMTMVLCEDDYLDYLVEVTGERGTSRSVIPAYLQSALFVSWLLVLGFRLQEWDFRTLFRAVINAHDKHTSPFLNLIIQLELDRQYHLLKGEDIRNQLNNAKDYLQEYLKAQSFEVRWNEPGYFMNKLIEEWKTRRQR